MSEELHLDPAVTKTTEDEVSWALDTLDVLDLDFIAKNSADAAEMAKWSVAVLWKSSGAGAETQKVPKVFKLLTAPKGIVWGEVLKHLPAFISNMKRRIDAKRNALERESRLQTNRPLSDDELPF